MFVDAQRWISVGRLLLWHLHGIRLLRPNLFSYWIQAGVVDCDPKRRTEGFYIPLAWERPRIPKEELEDDAGVKGVWDTVCAGKWMDVCMRRCVQLYCISVYWLRWRSHPFISVWLTLSLHTERVNGLMQRGGDKEEQKVVGSGGREERQRRRRTGWGFQALEGGKMR